METENRVYTKGQLTEIEFAKVHFPQLIRANLISDEEVTDEKILETLKEANITATKKDIKELLELCNKALEERKNSQVK